MGYAELMLIVGVFLGGAAPWLEAVVVIPAGIVAGLDPVVAAIAGVVGNLLTVAVAAWFGERLRGWWIERRRRKAERRGEDVAPAKPGGSRALRIARRWGMPVLALLGPLGLGTQVSAVVAVGIGVTPRAAFAWVGAGTLLWGVVAAVVTALGVSFIGIG